MITINLSIVVQVIVFVLIWAATWFIFLVARFGDDMGTKKELLWALLALVVPSGIFLWYHGYVTFI